MDLEHDKSSHGDTLFVTETGLITSVAVVSTSQSCLDIMTSNSPESIAEIEGYLLVLEQTPPSPETSERIFKSIRDYTTRQQYLDLLSTKRAIDICCRYGLADRYPNEFAMRCLCNILLQVESTRQMFVDGDYPKKVVERMKVRTHDHNLDDEFMSARLLLFCTYKTNLDVNELFENGIADIMSENISHYSELIGGGNLPQDAATRACSESLKLLYTLLSTCPSAVQHFRGALYPILRIFSATPILSPPLQPPLSSAINTFTYLDLDFRFFDENAYIDRLVHVLDLADQCYDAKAMNEHASSLVQVLLRLAQSEVPSIKSRLCQILLPSESDRESVLGKGASLPSRLLSLFTTEPFLSKLLPALYFELSDKNVTKFLGHVGFGSAAGFLHSNGLESEIPAWQSERIQDIDASATEQAWVNPVTGQRLDREREATSDMTDEEKEQEAERLFVLFERLRATGVINVENPLARAVEEGRFEELDD